MFVIFMKTRLKYWDVLLCRPKKLFKYKILSSCQNPCLNLLMQSCILFSHTYAFMMSRVQCLVVLFTVSLV